MVLTEIEVINFATEEMKKPFEWGVTDCNQVAARFLDLILERKAQSAEGIAQSNYSTQILRKYSTPLEAARFQKEFGKTPVQVLLDEGGTEVDPRFLQTGDFIIVEAETWQMLHIYLCGKVLSAGPENGVEMYPVEMLQRPYKVVRI